VHHLESLAAGLRAEWPDMVIEGPAVFTGVGAG